MVMKFRFINVRAGISLLENEMETGVVHPPYVKIHIFL